ncbi:MAG: RsmB/NOP family class I SAM-dependent RNA methyltransferase [Rhizobiales bacterium]|nr:RsmB/NOP family class I SAM-dependent RNA methyltransferase [Hyphomicrobiales bacterium]OJY46047.1 MAG: MFS transporter [Rhizobiales bacterium 64-17]
MTPAARLAAAIEVLTTIETDRKPAADTLKQWGTAHRFAGSGDRAAIAGLVYDALRRKASSAFLMGEDTPRAIALGMLVRERGLDVDTVARFADGSRHAPAVLNDDERRRIEAASLAGAPAWVAGDYPQWLDDKLADSFGDERVAEGEALASRAPLDLRVNVLKAKRDQVLADLSDLNAAPTPWSSWGLRIPLAADARSPGIHAEPAFIKGGIEIQDEGSQIAALLSAAKPGEQVLDLCAGAGGKTLALAAMLDNRGRLSATDSDKRRLAPIYERLERAGAQCVEVLTPKRDGGELGPLKGRCDLVLIDAPCSGTGAWRRNPDAKWRMRPGALEQRVKQQAEVLDRAVMALKPGGRIAYITCSVLEAENGAQVRAFLDRQAGFAVVPPEAVCDALGMAAADFKTSARLGREGLLMTPRRTGTDGFFVSLLRHQG